MGRLAVHSSNLLLFPSTTSKSKHFCTGRTRLVLSVFPIKLLSRLNLTCNRVWLNAFGAILPLAVSTTHLSRRIIAK